MGAFWPVVTIFEGNSEFLRQFRCGERPALARVYEHYVRDVFKLIRLGFLLKGPPPFHVPGIGEPAAQQDAVQDVFVKAFAERARLGYDGLRPYRPFLLQIARNLRVDAERRRRSELRLESSLAPPGRAVGELDEALGHAPSVPPDDQLDWRRKRAATVSFLEALDIESKQFVDLRFVEELSQNEVAERMSITRRRARTLEGRLLSSLRKHLQRELLG